MNLALWLQRSAQVWPERPAVAWGRDLVHTHAGLARAAASVAQGLQAAGVVPGDRVGLFMANSPNYLVALWAIWWAGAVAVPMNARLHGREAGWICAHSGQRLCLVDAEHADSLAPHAPAGCRLVVGLSQLGGPDDAAAADAAGAASAAPLPGPAVRHEDDAAWLFYTSGTTGRPKGVVLTQRNLRLCTLAYTATVQAVDPGDSFLHPAPLSHGSGLYHLPYVMNGGVNVVPRSPSLDEAEFFDLAAHWGQASSFVAPTILRRFTQHAQARGASLPRAADGGPRGLATLVMGGAPLYLADLEAAHQALGPHLAQIYGQGESPMTITVLPRALVADSSHPQWRERMASVGFAQPMVDLSIRTPEGAPLPIGAVGEVCVQGEVVMAGYWQDDAATAAAVRGGWLYTGDIGRLDEAGFLTLLDRSKDLVISGGNNIYPREVEEVLLTHPAVAEVAVIGRPDPQWGESLLACVVPAAGAPADAEALAAVLDAHCLAHLARYKRPKAYRVLAALPKNHYGKVLKTQLRTDAEGAG